MFTLIIDTSTDKSLVVFADCFKLLLKLFLPEGVRSSRNLMTAIASGFEQLQIEPSALQAVAVCTGPGSYTGIRVGSAAATGLAFSKKLPLISLCSLEGFITRVEGPFSSIIDARIGGAYVLLQECIEGQIYLRDEPQFISKDNLASYTAQYPITAGPHISYPDAQHLVNLSMQKLEKGEYSSELNLIYLRSPEYALTT